MYILHATDKPPQNSYENFSARLVSQMRSKFLMNYLLLREHLVRLINNDVRYDERSSEGEHTIWWLLTTSDTFLWGSALGVVVSFHVCMPEASIASQPMKLCDIYLKANSVRVGEEFALTISFRTLSSPVVSNRRTWMRTVFSVLRRMCQRFRTFSIILSACVVDELCIWSCFEKHLPGINPKTSLRICRISDFTSLPLRVWLIRSNLRSSFKLLW